MLLRKTGKLVSTQWFLGLIFSLFFFALLKPQTLYISYKSSNENDFFRLVPIPIDNRTKATSTLWPEDEKCSRFKTGFAEDLLPAYLISFPRSGNSWTRYLVEGATGIFTGSVYNDSNLYEMGFLGETVPANSRKVIVMKTHSPVDSKHPAPLLNTKEDRKVILLVRNPADAVISFYSFKSLNRKKRINAHINSIDEKIYRKSIFRKFLKVQIEQWSKIVEAVLIWTKELHVVFYENLMKDHEAEVKKILKFLNVPENEDRISCLKKYPKGPAQRKHSEIYPYTNTDKKLITKAMTIGTALFKLRGIEPPESYKQMVVKW